MTKKYYKCEETHQTFNGVKHKRCTKCKRWKEESEFCKDRARKDGLRIYCNGCNNAYVLRHSRRNRKGKKARVYLRFEDRHRVIRGFKEKLCSHCKKWKYQSEFHRYRPSKDGLSFWCKECVRKSYERIRKTDRRNLRYEDRHRVVNGVKEKLCRNCRKWKSETGFYKDRSQKDDLKDRCTKCTYKATKKTCKPKSKKKGARRNLRYEDRHRVIDGVKQKYCCKCKRWKNNTGFYKDSLRKDGLKSQCKKCSYKPVKRSHKRRSAVRN